MYESITYEELKSLPRDQKVEALKELKALYPTQKKIAEKLGVNPANIYNMIAKYVKEEDEGQPKAEVKAAGRAARKARRKIDAEAGTGTVSESGTENAAADIVDTTAGIETVDTETATAGTEALIAAEPVQEANAAAETVTGTAAAGSLKTRARRTRGRKKTAEENLLITLSKSLTGEEAQTLFSGISSIFIKNHDYRLEIRISER